MRHGKRRTARSYPEPIAVTLAYPDPPLACPAFVLRPFVAGDHAASAGYAADPGSARWVPPMPDDDPDRVVALFERFRADGELLLLVVADPADDAYLGEVMLVMGEDDVGEVGCGVLPGHRGADLGARALLLFDRWCVDVAGVERLQALVATDNPAGLELARRVGFRREGVLRGYRADGDRRVDVVMHSMLPGEVPVVGGTDNGPAGGAAAR